MGTVSPLLVHIGERPHTLTAQFGPFHRPMNWPKSKYARATPIILSCD